MYSSYHRSHQNLLNKRVPLYFVSVMENDFQRIQFYQKLSSFRVLGRGQYRQKVSGPVLDRYSHSDFYLGPEQPGMKPRE